MVEQTGLGYLCLSKREDVQKMCVGGGDAVKRVVFP